MRRLPARLLYVITVALAGLLAQAGLAQAPSARIALVIGNAAYKEAPLANPVNDARAMAQRLGNLGFKVTKLEDASRDQMADAIARFEESLGPDKTGLFYYAGHGVQVRGENYLIPVDADISSEARARTEGVRVRLVTSAMEYARSKVNFIILDACRNNPFERRLRGGSRGLAAVDAARGTLIAYATAPGSVAADGDGANGVYTAALLTALEEPGLQAEAVFKRVRTGVAEKTRGQQVPWESSSLTGNFVFNVPVSVTVQQFTPPAGLPQTSAATIELAFWDSIKDSSLAADFEAYLQQYPTGSFALLARNRLQTLGESAAIAATRPPPIEQTRVDPYARDSGERVAALLAAAAQDVRALRLTSPKTSNAVDKYRGVLALDADNAQATAGLGVVVGKYIELAEQAVARGNLIGAQSYLDRAAGVQPGTETVEIARGRLLANLPSAMPPTSAPAPTPTAARPGLPAPEMVRIAGGCYQMGSPVSEERRDLDERQHRVCVDGFGIGKTEVTVGEFRRFADAAGYLTDAERNTGGRSGCWIYEDGGGAYRAGRNWRSPGFAQGVTYPVVCVSWNDAAAYAAWLSGETGRRYRLPTEAEWEYAARAGSSTSRFWGDDPNAACDYANVANTIGRRPGQGVLAALVNTLAEQTMGHCEDGFARTAPVGRYRANGNGLHDILGNVWEWTCSDYDQGYSGGEQRCTLASAGGRRAARGTSWMDPPGFVRTADRAWDYEAGRGGFEPTDRGDIGGFRLVQD